MEWLASIDGEPVAHARAFPGPRGLLLDGGATLPSARGRGAYRALIAARWDEAVARGTPALVVQAQDDHLAPHPRAMRLRGRLHHVRSGTRSAVNDALREFAQNPDRYTRIPADVDRFADERVCVLQGTTWAGVSGVRIEPPDVERCSPKCANAVAPEKSVTWWLDPDTQPSDLYERLLALGLQEPRDRGSLLHALACVDGAPARPRRCRRHARRDL